MRKRINGLILAAGLSSRMGDFKPLMPLRGKTLIENSIDSMLLAGVNQVVVVLGHRGDDLEAILRSRYVGDTIVTIYNRAYATTDMLTSVKVGLSVMPDCDAFFLLPGDMPVVAKETFLAVYRAMPEKSAAITFPTAAARYIASRISPLSCTPRPSSENATQSGASASISTSRSPFSP